MRRAVITGVTGQDGSFLAELLLQRGYEVFGVHRRSSTLNLSRLANVLENKNFKLVEGDISDAHSVLNIVKTIKPDEYYNLGAQSHVHTSFEQPSYTFDINFNGVLNALEAILVVSKNIRFYQASTSEMFGKNYSEEEYNGVGGPAHYKFQNENTPFMPQSPYAIAKLAAHHLVRNYRDSYDLFACSGILFNHESERRGENFVTRKITKWIGGFVASGKDPSYPKLHLGNLNAHRDWGYAKDYVEAMWKMLQTNTPDDYVIATGKTVTVRDFLNEAFRNIDIKDWSDLVVVDSKFYRPSEVEYLCGDFKRAKRALNWEPATNFRELVQIMVENDVKEERLRRSSLQAV